MNKLRALMLIAVVGAAGTIYASSSNWLNGTVTDQDGKPLAGVEVYVDKSPAVDTTGADGKYQFDSTVDPKSSVRHMSQRQNPSQPILLGKTISYTVTKPQTVRMEILDLSGRCVRSVVNGAAVPQNYSIELPVEGLSPSTYVLSVNLGGDRFVQRVLLQENGVVQSGKSSAGAANTLNKRNASGVTDEIDFLHFYKQKFTQVDTPIHSYKGTFNIKMAVEDTLPPVITLLGGDTVSYAFQDSVGGWLKFWDQDSFSTYVKIEDNSGFFQFTPSTNTLIDHERSSLNFIPYQAWDPSNNLGKAMRLLVLYDSTVQDAVPPVLTVTPDTLRLTKGDLFDPLTGVTAADSADKHIFLTDWINITDNIQTTADRTADITMDVVGTYTVTYTVMDTHKNKTTKKRTLIVSEPPAAQ